MKGGDELTVKEAVIYLEKLLKHETPISSNFFKVNGGISNGLNRRIFQRR